jgi:hypothetical protein
MTFLALFVSIFTNSTFATDPRPTDPRTSQEPKAICTSLLLAGLTGPFEITLRRAQDMIENVGPVYSRGSEPGSNVPTFEPRLLTIQEANELILLADQLGLGEKMVARGFRELSGDVKFLEAGIEGRLSILKTTLHLAVQDRDSHVFNPFPVFGSPQASLLIVSALTPSGRTLELSKGSVMTEISPGETGGIEIWREKSGKLWGPEISWSELVNRAEKMRYFATLTRQPDIALLASDPLAVAEEIAKETKWMGFEWKVPTAMDFRLAGDNSLKGALLGNPDFLKFLNRGKDAQQPKAQLWTRTLSGQDRAFAFDGESGGFVESRRNWESLGRNGVRLVSEGLPAKP